MGVTTLIRLASMGFLVTACASPAAPTAIEPERPSQETFLRRAVYADHRLWVLSDAGALFSIEEGKDDRTRESIPDPVSDICIQDAQPLAIAGNRSRPDALTLWHRTNGTWTAGAKVPIDHEALVALSCSQTGVTLLTTRRLIDLVDGRQHGIGLSDKLPFGLVTAVHDDGNQFFVGIDAGEWGGGLRQIDRRSGQIKEIERNATGELCGGPLNSGCDPVNGIVSDPWKPGCVVVAVGLVHFSPHGRLVEICGDRVERLYVKAYGTQPPGARNMKMDEPFNSVAFFGLIRKDNALWAAGIDGLYQFDGKQAPNVTPMPKFKSIGGFYVSYDLPGIVLVLTEVNERASLSGATPMLVAR